MRPKVTAHSTYLGGVLCGQKTEVGVFLGLYISKEACELHFQWAYLYMSVWSLIKEPIKGTLGSHTWRSQTGRTKPLLGGPCQGSGWLVIRDNQPDLGHITFNSTDLGKQG